MGSSQSLEAASKINKAADLKSRNALCFGATAGIGEAMAARLATQGANVTIVGRNEEAGKRIVGVLQKNNANGKHNFVKADLMLLSSCKKVCEDYMNSHERLDYVVFTQTKATFQGRTETKEGLDEKLGLNYYTRVFMTNTLLPLLRKTADKDPQSDVRVMSVLAAGKHGGYPLWKSDTRLEKAENYGSKNAADCAVQYNDLAFDKLAKMDENKGKVTFIHSYPGFVNTNWGSDMNIVVRCGIRVLQATAARSAEDCGEYLVRALVEKGTKNENDSKAGVRLVGEYGLPDAQKTKYHTDEAVEYVWKDTLELLESAEKKGAAKQ